MWSVGVRLLFFFLEISCRKAGVGNVPTVVRSWCFPHVPVRANDVAKWGAFFAFATAQASEWKVIGVLG